MGAAIYNGTAVIETTGNRVQLRSTSNQVSWFNVVASPINLHYLKVGSNGVTDSDTAATDGYSLGPGKSVRLGACKTDQVYINGKAGDRVYFVAGYAT